MSTTVEALHDLGRDALLEGRPALDVAPVDGSRRWGLSVLARPHGDLADRLDAATADLVALAGPGQWATGSAGTSHLTLFSLEPHRSAVSLADPDVCKYASATARAAAGLTPATFSVTGLGLTPGGVIAACEPIDDPARALRPALAAELGGDVFELAYRGHHWWMSLMHFAAPVARPVELVAHVEGRRHEPMGLLPVEQLELVRYEHRRDRAGARMVPVPLVTLALTGVGEEASGGAHS